ncbi:hypothetical protein, partial [Massilia genomosp. 1]|uniref:hypothetical protein n=1 Tax=Massilia genomosp. 1 TaxID=2609280 RepID=UPI001C9E2A01
SVHRHQVTLPEHARDYVGNDAAVTGATAGLSWRDSVRAARAPLKPPVVVAVVQNSAFQR